MELIKDILMVAFFLSAVVCMIALAIGAIYQAREERRSYRAMLDKLTLTCTWREKDDG